ncbi:MAG: Flagellar biosynthesis protein FlhA [Myxococcaceae bacterium]|nr:Flagellar biosynthesis protein FlhA [Myxococcaceae bacterium]
MVKTEPAYVALTPILLEISSDFQSRQAALIAQTAQLRQRLFLELGIRFPAVEFRESEKFTGGAYRILFGEVPIASFVTRPGMFLASESAERLKSREFDCAPAVHPATFRASAWVAKAEATQLEDQGVRIDDAEQVMIEHLGALLKRHARTFVKVQAVQDMLDALAVEAPALVRAIVPGVVSLLQLTEVLGRLVEEELSIRDLPTILQAVAEHWRVGMTSMKLTEEVRASMRTYVSHRFAPNRGTLVTYLLDPAIEESIRSAIQTTPDGTVYLSLEPELAQSIVQAVKEESGLRSGQALQPVILTTADIRRYVRKLLEFEFNPPFAVVSYQELSPELNIQPVARISLRA